jgi:LacI family transcriptional regulator
MSINHPLRITHQDIARKFGCDKSTVSLALRDNPRIPLQTRVQIQGLAARMGYRPDPALAMLARQRWAKHDPEVGSTLAFIVNRKRSFYSVQAPYLRGAIERARERGYQLIEFDLDEYPSGRAASKVLYNRGIRGLILACIPPDELAPIVALDWEKFTVVSLSHGWGHIPVHAVGINYFESTRMVWREVAARGYQRIGAALFQESPSSIVDAERQGACHIAQRDLIPPEQRIPVLLCDFQNKSAFFSWVKQHRPEVIISRWAGVYDWLIDEGYKIPRDIAFAGFRVEEGRPIAGASIMVNHIGRAAVDTVVAQMHENRWGIPEIRQTLQLEPVWVDGATLPDRKARAIK